MNIVITLKAEKFITRMIRFNGGGASAGFRLSVTPGGCSGLSSEFTVEAAPFAGDATLESNGVKVFLPAESRILLEGVTIDFNDTAMATGLSFINPNAQSCGCSTAESSSAPPKTASVSIGSIQRRH
jgi:iron-sulfur cluster assembly protein